MGCMFLTELVMFLNESNLCNSDTASMYAVNVEKKPDVYKNHSSEQNTIMINHSCTASV